MLTALSVPRARSLHVHVQHRRTVCTGCQAGDARCQQVGNSAGWRARSHLCAFCALCRPCEPELRPAALHWAATGMFHTCLLTRLVRCTAKADLSRWSLCCQCRMGQSQHCHKAARHEPYLPSWRIFVYCSQGLWDASQQPPSVPAIPGHAPFPPPDAMSAVPGWGAPPSHMPGPPQGI